MKHCKLMSETSNKTIDTLGQATIYHTGEPVRFYYKANKVLKIRYSAKKAEKLAIRNRIKRMLKE